MRLKQNSKKIQYANFELNVASVEDLLVLKKNRKDKSASDYADIEFLSNILRNQKK